MSVPSRQELNALLATDILDPLPKDSLLSALANPPFVPTKTLFNIRDAGAVDGSGLPTGRIFRCGILEFASKDEEALTWLSEHVTHIFDLRRAEERLKSPDPEVPGVKNIWHETEGDYGMPLDLELYAQDDGSTGWSQHYMIIAATHAPIIRAVLEHVRDRPTEGFLFHCTAGRDRTGVVAGLLQALAGTAPEDIIFDYLLSRIGMEPARDLLFTFMMTTTGATDVNTPGFANLVSLRASSWKAFAAHMQTKYGGWDSYVTQHLGFSAEDLAVIKKNLKA